MYARPDVLIDVLIVGGVAYACRAGGHFMMRYVTLTPPVQRWLQAIPISIVGAILGPVAATGGPPEWAGLAAAIGLMWITGWDFAGVLGGTVAVAVVRWLGL